MKFHTRALQLKIKLKIIQFVWEKCLCAQNEGNQQQTTLWDIKYKQEYR